MSHDFPQFITGGQGLFTTHTKSNPPAACHHRRPNISKKPSDLPIFAIVLTMDLLEIGALQSSTFVLQWHQFLVGVGTISPNHGRLCQNDAT